MDANPLYDNWGMLGALAAVLSLIAAGVFWLHQRKPSQVELFRVKVRAGLSELLQQTVVSESRAIFRRLEQYVAQNPGRAPGQTFLDRVQEAIQTQAGQGDEDPDSDDDGDGGGDPGPAVADAIDGYLLNLIDTALEDLARAAREKRVDNEVARAVPLGFAAETNRKLVFIATTNHKARTWDRRYSVSRRFSLIFGAVALTCLVALIFLLLINSGWAHRAGLLTITVFAIALLGAGIETTIGVDAYNRLEEVALRCESGDIEDDMHGAPA